MSRPKKDHFCTNCNVLVKKRDSLCRECYWAWRDQCAAMQYGYNGPLKEKDFKVFKLPEGKRF